MEVDIQHMIEMNRVTRLLHKARFQSRQKRILAYSHKYVVTADDLLREQETTSQKSSAKKSQIEIEAIINDLICDFDAEKNESDRRIFFEVTGRQLIDGEFNDVDTSDEERAILAAPNPLAQVFEQSDSDTDNENQVALISRGSSGGGSSDSDGKSATKIN